FSLFCAVCLARQERHDEASELIVSLPSDELRAGAASMVANDSARRANWKMFSGFARLAEKWPLTSASVLCDLADGFITFGRLAKAKRLLEAGRNLAEKAGLADRGGLLSAAKVARVHARLKEDEIAHELLARTVSAALGHRSSIWADEIFQETTKGYL